MLSIGILTTDTIHHRYFVQRVSEACENVKIFVEQKQLTSPFPVAHPYENERNQIETQAWFRGGCVPKLAYFAPCVYLNDLNAEESKNKLRTHQADIYITFGTGKLSKTICDEFAGRLINLHGGDPQKYRG